MVSGLGDVKDRIAALEAGVDDFLTKPFDTVELKTRVGSLLKVKAYHDRMRDHEKELEKEVAARTSQLTLALKGTKAASLETIYCLTRASEYKDESTGEHVKRMSRYAAVIAGKMGLGEETIERILYAAPMHDIGKIGIPDDIILKPGKLNEAEWRVMKQHTIIGSYILAASDAEVIKLGRDIALTHHEKWDGSGYPRGLKGTEIPVTGRIAGIADVFDALTSKRPYKEAFSTDKSFAIIAESRGSHFDPRIVDAFFAVKEEILRIMSENGTRNNPVVKAEGGATAV
jgi:putative two-component system response regulator